MTTPAVPEFEVYERGYIRDRVVLATIRAGLRSLVNPETGAPFTEDEIQRATRPRGRLWSRAEAIDLYAQAEQRSAVYLADQIQIDRANDAFLDDYHAVEIGERRLDATGGAGVVSVQATPGTVILGSTTLPDPSAYKARDAAGNTYQVFATAVTPSGGSALVTMAAIDTGAGTNPLAGDRMTWTLRDPNMAPECEVNSDFTGGVDAESSADFAKRLLAAKAFKQGAGNDAQTRAWTRAASNSIEDAFVYPCAQHAGSVVIAVTQKRGNVAGPNARLPNTATMTAAIAYMTPPSSPVYPTPPHVVVTRWQPQPVHFTVRMSMPKASLAGFADLRPFPSYAFTAPAVSSVSSQLDFTVTSTNDNELPGQAPLVTLTGAAVPSLMVWHESSSRFERLDVASIEDLGSNEFRVQLASEPDVPIDVGDVISPYVERHDTIAEEVEAYFDELGPGDLFDVETDPRGVRCVRFPESAYERPAQAGGVVATRILEALSGSAANATVGAMSSTAPIYPDDPTDGPYMLTLGRFGVYSL